MLDGWSTITRHDEREMLVRHVEAKNLPSTVIIAVVGHSSWVMRTGEGDRGGKRVITVGKIMRRATSTARKKCRKMKRNHEFMTGTDQIRVIDRTPRAIVNAVQQPKRGRPALDSDVHPFLQERNMAYRG